ncbi:hypothetical protein ESCOMM300M1_16425 [Escherichia coli]
MTSLKTSIKTITYLSDIGCLEIQGASLTAMPVPEGQRLTADQPLFFHETASKLASHLVVSPGCNCGDVPCSAIKLNYLTT